MPVSSVYPKPMQSYRKVDTRVHNPVTQSRSMRVTLDKNHFLAENRMTFSVSQAFSVAPASFNVRNVIERLQVIMKNGNLIDLDGYETVDVCRYIGGASLERTTLGLASTAIFALDLHYQNNDALHDLQTGMHTDKFQTLDLLITFTPTLGFVGGVAPVLPALPNQQIAFDLDAIYYEDYDRHPELGNLLHKQCSTRKNGAGAGVQEKFLLEVGGLNRFIMLHLNTLNADGTLTPNDGILSKITFKIGDAVKREYDAFELQADVHERRGGFLQTGVYCIDFGDDEAGWADLKNAKEASLVIEAVAGAPAKWVANIMQDQTVPLALLNGAPKA